MQVTSPLKVQQQGSEVRLGRKVYRRIALDPLRVLQELLMMCANNQFKRVDSKIVAKLFDGIAQNFPGKFKIYKVMRQARLLSG